jgi:hypothetical protein
MPSRVFRFWEANQIIPAIIGFIPVYVMDIPAVWYIAYFFLPNVAMHQASVVGSEGIVAITPQGEFFTIVNLETARYRSS